MLDAPLHQSSGSCKYEYELITPSLLLSGTRLYTMSGDHGNCMQANLTSTHLPCYWLQIMMIESYRCTRWSYWRWVSFANRIYKSLLYGNVNIVALIWFLIITAFIIYYQDNSFIYLCICLFQLCVLFSFIDFVLLFVSVVCVIFSSIV